MSLSSSRVGYKHRCTIQVNAAAEGGTDEWGDPIDPAWTDHLVNVPCRAWTNGATEPVDDNRTVVMEDRRISVGLSTDVTEQHRVLEVTDRWGNLIFDGPMSVEGALRHTDHLELMVERIR